LGDGTLIAEDAGRHINTQHPERQRTVPTDPRLIHRVIAEIKTIKEQLSEQSNKNNNQPAKEPIATDRITAYEPYFPGLSEETKIMLHNLGFRDRVLMCSTTIERNESYQETYQLWAALEKKIIEEVVREHGHPLSLEVDHLIEKIQRKCFQDRGLQRLQYDLFRMRLKRNRIEAMIQSIESAAQQPGRV
jgi:hypothetical protein